jgi:mRNA-degrading endonuclease RelE of RelBE toxin-antitoxin system
MGWPRTLLPDGRRCHRACPAAAVLGGRRLQQNDNLAVHSPGSYYEARAYQIVVHELAIEELKSIRVFDQRRILAAIREQLADQPSLATRRRKCLIDLAPSFEHSLPVWELRVGAFRVFYDVAEDEKYVHIRAVRLKQPRQRTEDIV